jgi:hypothetical protein
MMLSATSLSELAQGYLEAEAELARMREALDIAQQLSDRIIEQKWPNVPLLAQRLRDALADKETP